MIRRQRSAGIRRLLITPCAIVTPRIVRDEYNDTTENWDLATTVRTGCHIERVDDVEEQPNGPTFQARWRVVLSADVVVATTARIHVDGMVLDVLGRPDLVRRPGGSVHHQELVAAEIVTTPPPEVT